MKPRAKIKLERNIKLSEAFNSAGCSVGIELTCPQTPENIKKTIARGWDLIDKEIAAQHEDIRKILSVVQTAVQPVVK